MTVLRSDTEQLTATLLALTRLADGQRTIVAGSFSDDIHAELLRRGVFRAATMSSCRVAWGQYDAAFVVGREASHGFESLMFNVLPFLKVRSAFAVWIDPDQHGRASIVQTRLRQAGFCIEAGSRCGRGFVVSARRLEWKSVAKIA
ncbi:hypothetical protein [Bradyrhizobium sp. LHD-71]|uniref:hypothetical protein n=1 Tax=Bradyrhizobium sp. LHD-71 TaxID=3072141 RepID=UPI00280C4123|nr:hypothetical protein [Bradyrhizobium sp. LHD-71]MDQ8729727.1 hypothetical protein [Bradyrhizobium sp. LHD-71]